MSPGRGATPPVAGPGGLSHPPGAEKGHDRKLPEQQTHTVQMVGSEDINSIEL